jgi:tol-pal system protein YbgF
MTLYSRQSMNRRGLMLAPIACIILMTGCVATKSDVQMLHNDIVALQTRQDSLYRESLGRLSSQADSVRMLSETLRTARGQLSNQIRQLQDMLITVQELMGTNAQTVRQLRDQLERQQTAATAAAQVPAAPAAGSSGDADNLYAAGRAKLDEKSAAAARAAFEQFLEQYPQHERAPDAQFGLAEALYLDGDLADAITQFERVASAFPTSPRAPEALYRAGQISEQRDRRTEARRFYNLVVTRYAGTPSARLAQQRITALR